MTKPRVPRDLLAPVVEYFKPQRVILFGSRARGEATRDSDIDLLVVVDDDTPPEKLTWRAGYEAHRSRRAADVFPMRAETFERDRTVVGTLAAEADIDGIVVYGSPKGSPSVKGPDPRARWEAVEGWLEAAEQDRKTAAVCLAAESPLRGSAAFHCQQAVEKLLKGFLVLAAKRSRKTHSLAQLGTAAQGSFPEISDLVAAAKDWSGWAVDFRYPTRRGRMKPAPYEDELHRALAVIDALAARLRAANPDPPVPPSRRAAAERSSG
jgi:HEPN domain-containing protein